MTQEARQMGILRPAAKEPIRVESTKRIPELLRRTLSVAARSAPSTPEERGAPIASERARMGEVIRAPGSRAD